MLGGGFCVGIIPPEKNCRSLERLLPPIPDQPTTTVLVKVEPVEDDDLGPMPETALEEPEVEEEVEPEEQEVADDLGPVPEAALEEPEMEDEAEEGHEEQKAADDLGPAPEAAREEPEMEEERGLRHWCVHDLLYIFILLLKIIVHDHCPESCYGTQGWIPSM